MILLARHGRTGYNHEGRFQGQSSVPLDLTGRAEAAALAARIAARGDVTRLVSSPLTRALETASFVAARTGLVPEIAPGLAETDTGAWTHRLYAEIIAGDADAYAAFRRLDLDFGAPGGETFAAQRDRVNVAMAEIRAADRDRAGSACLPAGEPVPGEPVTLVVAHGNVIRLLLRHERGTAPSHEDVPNAFLEAV